jgi:cell division protein FtsA
VALDIGSSHVRAAAAYFEDNQLIRIGEFGEVCSKGVRHGAIVDIRDAAQSIRRALALVGNPSLPVKQVITTVSGKQIASLNSSSVTAVTRSSRRIAAEDVARAIEQAKVIVLPPDREIIHCIPRMYRVDGQEGVSEPVGMFGNRLELDSHLVTTTFSHMQNIEAAVQQAGADVMLSIAGSLAASEAVLMPEERKLGVMVVDIGEGASDIAIYMDGRIAYTSVIPYGSGQITGDLSACLRIPWDDAERMKKHCGSFSMDIPFSDDPECFSAAEIGTGRQKQFSVCDLEEIIHPRTEELFCHIRAELIKSGFYNLLAAGAVLTGGGARLSGIAALSSKVLRMPVRLGVPKEGPQFAAVIGAFLYAAEHFSTELFRNNDALQDGVRQVKLLWNLLMRPVVK